jgi:hypothetical protein
MTQKPAKKSANFDLPLFVFGLDENGRPRGARFAEVKDEIVNAALNMKCWVVYPAPEEFVPHGMKLPAGRLYASGRAFIPTIRRDLYDKLFATKGKDAAFLRESEKEGEKPPRIAEGQAVAAATAPEIACVSPGLPRSWEAIGVGHMVLIHESPEDGWWEAVVIQRENEVLTLRFRDYPRLPTVIRHISTVALVNPGPA